VTGSEYPQPLLGHRTGTRTKVQNLTYDILVDSYSVHPVLIPRPARGRVRTSVRCEHCGETVRLKLWGRATWLRWAVGYIGEDDWIKVIRGRGVHRILPQGTTEVERIENKDTGEG
jgi:hypothetical protein